ncbi:MAG: DHH family phosphoesterase [Desulfobulbaceae bacterium]|nr:DHH family phosphoesterase [Desulfobulbaceae bacterium]
MLHIDVFNGDADGICALHQLRLDKPEPDARIITGVKRDIRLLSQIQDVAGAAVTALDISLDRNRNELEKLLGQGNRIFYVDHHFCGKIPDSKELEAHIDLSPATCTALIVDSLLQGKYRAWAIAGAFGDNLDEVARDAAKKIGIDGNFLEQLREIGVLLNYNGYGAILDDLFYHPADLYGQVRRYEDPFEFHARSPAMEILRDGYSHDIELAARFEPLRESEHGRIFQFPAKAWARRVAGVYSNILAREKPDMAHTLIIKNNDGTFRISVRAPLNSRTGADELCRAFPTGGGRAAAAGINSLPQDRLEQFHTAFFEQFSRSGQK